MTVHDLTIRQPVVRVQAGRRRRMLTFVAEHSVAIALALVFLAPFAFIVLTSVMTNEQALTPDLWPTSWHLDNYAKVFQDAPMFRYLANSLMYSVLATGFMLLPPWRAPALSPRRCAAASPVRPAAPRPNPAGHR